MRLIRVPPVASRSHTTCAAACRAGTAALLALALVPAVSVADAVPPQIHTVAGGGSCSGVLTLPLYFPGPCDGVPATSVPIETARSVAALPGGGYLYIDEVNDLVREVSPTGIVTTVAGTGVEQSINGQNQTNPNPTDSDCVAATASGLDDPVAVAPLPGGGFLITEDAGNRVRMVAPTGIITTVAGALPTTGSTSCETANGATLNYPLDAVPTAGGGVLIADTYDNRILLVSPGGAIATIAGGGSSCNDAANACNGDQASQVRLNEPDSVSEIPGGGGAYLVSELSTALGGTDSIREISQEASGGTFTTVAGIPGDQGYSGDGGPATAAQLNNPFEVVALTGGGFLVADSGNNAVREVSPGGLISTIAGDGTDGFTGDGGAATAAELNGPAAVAPTSEGGILIADENNSVIREITQPSVSTITVAPNAPNGANGWYTSPPSVSVAATEGAFVSCVLDPGQAPPVYGAITPSCLYANQPDAIAQNGIHTLYVASENSFGDQEHPINITLKVDTTPPRVTCKKKPVFRYGQLKATVAAVLSDSVSGPGSSLLQAQVATRSAGTHTVMLSGSNLAGLSGSARCSYQVKPKPKKPRRRKQHR